MRIAITAIPFTGLIDADCRFTVYSRSSTNGPVRSYISNFVLEVKLLLYQPWPPPSSARRLLVLRHGPSARLQGVAIVAPASVIKLFTIQQRRHRARLRPGHCHEDRHCPTQTPAQETQSPRPRPHYFHLPPHARLHHTQQHTNSIQKIL